MDQMQSPTHGGNRPISPVTRKRIFPMPSDTFSGEQGFKIKQLMNQQSAKLYNQEKINQQQQQLPRLRVRSNTVLNSQNNSQNKFQNNTINQPINPENLDHRNNSFVNNFTPNNNNPDNQLQQQTSPQYSGQIHNRHNSYHIRPPSQRQQQQQSQLGNFYNPTQLQNNSSNQQQNLYTLEEIRRLESQFLHELKSNKQLLDFERENRLKMEGVVRDNQDTIRNLERQLQQNGKLLSDQLNVNQHNQNDLNNKIIQQESVQQSLLQHIKQLQQQQFDGSNNNNNNQGYQEEIQKQHEKSKHLFNEIYRIGQKNEQLELKMSQMDGQLQNLNMNNQQQQQQMPNQSQQFKLQELENHISTLQNNQLQLQQTLQSLSSQQETNNPQNSKLELKIEDLKNQYNFSIKDLQQQKQQDTQQYQILMDKIQEMQNNLQQQNNQNNQQSQQKIDQIQQQIKLQIDQVLDNEHFSRDQGFNSIRNECMQIYENMKGDLNLFQNNQQKITDQITEMITFEIKTRLSSDIDLKDLTSNIANDFVTQINQLKQVIDHMNLSRNGDITEMSNLCQQRSQQLSLYIEQECRKLLDIFNMKTDQLKGIVTKLAEQFKIHLENMDQMQQNGGNNNVQNQIQDMINQNQQFQSTYSSSIQSILGDINNLKKEIRNGGGVQQQNNGDLFEEQSGGRGEKSFKKPSRLSLVDRKNTNNQDIINRNIILPENQELFQQEGDKQVKNRIIVYEQKIKDLEDDMQTMENYMKEVIQTNEHNQNILNKQLKEAIENGGGSAANNQNSSNSNNNNSNNNNQNQSGNMDVNREIEDIWKYVDQNKAYTQYNDERLDKLFNNADIRQLVEGKVSLSDMASNNNNGSSNDSKDNKTSSKTQKQNSSALQSTQNNLSDSQILAQASNDPEDNETFDDANDCGFSKKQLARIVKHLKLHKIKIKMGKEDTQFVKDYIQEGQQINEKNQDILNEEINKLWEEVYKMQGAALEGGGGGSGGGGGMSETQKKNMDIIQNNMKLLEERIDKIQMNNVANGSSNRPKEIDVEQDNDVQEVENGNSDDAKDCGYSKKVTKKMLKMIKVNNIKIDYIEQDIERMINFINDHIKQNSCAYDTEPIPAGEQNSSSTNKQSKRVKRVTRTQVTGVNVDQLQSILDKIVDEINLNRRRHDDLEYRFGSVQDPNYRETRKNINENNISELAITTTSKNDLQEIDKDIQDQAEQIRILKKYVKKHHINIDYLDGDIDRIIAFINEHGFGTFSEKYTKETITRETNNGGGADSAQVEQNKNDIQELKRKTNSIESRLDGANQQPVKQRRGRGE